MTITIYQNDIPADIDWGTSVAIDTEATGLNFQNNRLCLAQLSKGDGHAILVQFDKDGFNAPNLCKLLTDPTILKIFHFARFDMAIFQKCLGVGTAPVFCTKIASKLVRTYTDRHGLKELCKEFLNIELPKQQASSDWAVDVLSPEQQQYAASDVLYLHVLKDKLEFMLKREGRFGLAHNCFEFLPVRVVLDLVGWNDEDIFAHGST